MENNYMLSRTQLLFRLSLAYSSVNMQSEDNDVDFDDGFVFDIDPSLLVDLHKLTFGEMIGEGAYSSVFKGWYEDRPVAIKVILPERTVEATPECKAKFQREVNLLAKLEHKNIVKFIGASVRPSMMIITELLEGGSLQKTLKNAYPATLGLEISLCYALDISQAMEYLHTYGIIHRDLKPGNILLTEDKLHVKLADFGIAREDSSDEMTCEAGSYRFMAPELFSRDPLPIGAKKCYDRKADVYSFGILLWSLIKNQTPFKGRKAIMAAYATANNMRPSVEGFPEHILPLLQSCWEQDPKLRPEFSEITETLLRILLDCCSTDSSASSLDSNDENQIDIPKEEEAPTSQPETMEENIIPIKLDDDDDDDDVEIMKSNGCKEISDSELASQKLLPDSPESKPKKKRKLNFKFLSFLRCCFSF